MTDLETTDRKVGDRMYRFAASLLCACMLAAPTARADWVDDSNVHALRVLEVQAEFSPEGVSAQGLDQFDADVIDLGPDLLQRRRARYSELIDHLQKQSAREDHPKVRQDLAILIQSLEDSLDSSQIYYDHLVPYFNLHRQLFGGFNRLLDPRAEAARYPAAKARLQKYNGTAVGFTSVVDQAIALSTARFGAEGLAGPFRGELEADLANAPRMVAGLRSTFERAELEGWEEDFDLLTQQLDRYTEWLRDEMLPRARPGNQLPPEVYATNLRNFGVRATPEQLISEAQYSYQMIRSEMKALAWKIADKRGWQDRELVSVMRALKKEQVPQDRILDLYRERLAAIEDIIRREDLVTLPERDAVIRLATEAESANIPASFMSPPQLINNTGQYGEFVLVQSNPALGAEAQMDDWSHDAITWALTVHEARPGHELQFASMVENGTSLARAIFAFNSANVEGWGLYAESIMQEFLPLEGQLFNLFTRLMRAARMFMDPMVNTGRMTHAQAIDFMMEQTALSRAMASSEADRYAFRMPGQATAYYHGYTKLMSLRTEVEIARGAAFDQKAFHDFILAQGLLPHDLLREAVLDEFVR